MLTGKRLFEGRTVTDVLANALKQDDDWNQLPTTTPLGLVRVLRRCLDRKLEGRIRDIGDARQETANPGLQTDAAIYNQLISNKLNNSSSPNY